MILAAGLSDVGCRRDTNQDRISIDLQYLIFVVDCRFRRRRRSDRSKTDRRGSKTRDPRQHFMRRDWVCGWSV